MPCSSAKARILLKEKKAKVVRREPFTIQLRYWSSGYRQPVVAGMDTGSQVISCAAIAHGRVVYQAEIEVRQDVSSKMQQRKMYRRSRRSRKTRYRPACWQNRASMRAESRLAPSLRSKVDSHFREKRFVQSILPVSNWEVETAAFDIHKITNPEVDGVDYQNGDQKGFYNVKAYVLHRDGYGCTSGRKVKHAAKLQVHHVIFRSQGGTDAPSNLRTLCEVCHDDLHAGLFQLPARRSITKHPTEMGIIQAALLRSGWEFESTFGYQTKYKREVFLNWEKSHAADAVAIACEEGRAAGPSRKPIDSGGCTAQPGRASGNRLCDTAIRAAREPGTKYVYRADLFQHGSEFGQEHACHRARESAVPGRVLQRVQPDSIRCARI